MYFDRRAEQEDQAAGALDPPRGVRVCRAFARFARCYCRDVRMEFKEPVSLPIPYANFLLSLSLSLWETVVEMKAWVFCREFFD